MTAEAPTLGLAALAGLALGSYAVTAAIRFARAEPSSVGRSHCDGCGQALSFAQTVPVLSYIRARGSCAACQARIDPIHLVGELSGLLILVTAVSVGDPTRAALLSILGLILLTASAIDWKIGRLPNILTGSAALVALALATLKSRGALEAGLVVAALAFLAFMGFRLVREKTRGDPGLGLGDVKLICALSLWLGTMAPWMVIAANVGALVVVKMVRPGARRVHMGAAYALAAWIVGMGGEWGFWPTTL